MFYIIIIHTLLNCCKLDTKINPTFDVLICDIGFRLQALISKWRN